MDIYLLQNVTTISDLLNSKYYIDNVFLKCVNHGVFLQRLLCTARQH